MSKQLILVVHGVGVREAGVATGQLSAVLSDRPDPEDARAMPWVPHSSDDFLLHEDPLYSEDGLAKVFPAHLRRYRRTMDGKAQERIVADYFWGDIAGTGLTGLRVMVGLVKIVLGLSHAVRENAFDVFPGDGAVERTLRKLARCAALTIHGPIVALNLVLMAGAFITLAWHALNRRALQVELQPELGPFWTEMVLGVGTILAGFLILYSAKVFLVRHLATWLVATGVLVVITDLAQTFRPDAMAGYFAALNRYVFNLGPQIDYGRASDQVAQGFAVLAAVLMATMVAAWVLTFVLAWIVLFAAVLRRRRAKAAIIVPQAIALMCMLWILLMLSAWLVILVVHWWVSINTGFQLPLGLKADMVMACLRLATPAALGLVLLAVVGLFLHGRKAFAFSRGRFGQTADYLPDRVARAEANRLIVGRALLWVLNLFMVAITVFFVMAVWPDCQLLWKTCSGIRDLNSNVAVPLMGSATFVVVAFIIFFGRKGLAAGVAIFTDVLIYLNDYSWTSRERIDGRKMIARTWLERLLGRHPKGGGGYWLRGRIYARMYVLLNRLAKDEKPDEIVIVSHSQGTVIAMDLICRLGRGWVKWNGHTTTLKLVTMGSPYTHLYAKYFPTDFAEAGGRKELLPVAKGGLLSEWINIFRVDDFVGTHIDSKTQMVARPVPQGWPREHPVPRGGHTNYWVDEAVTAILASFLPFRPPSDGEGGAAPAGGGGIGVLDDKAGADQLLREVDHGTGQKGQ